LRKNCFFLTGVQGFLFWDYEEMLGLSKDLVEHKLPIQEGRKLVKKAPRRFDSNVVEVIKAKVKRFLNAKFICTTWYLNGFLT